VLLTHGDDALSQLDPVTRGIATSLEWAEEGRWLHEQQKADRIKQWGQR
jgi:hypothetical protein